VVVFSSDGCASDPSDPFAVVVTGVERLRSSVKIYPNPVDDVLHISSGNDAALKITITDINGTIVMAVPHDERSIDVSRLPSGIYFLQLQNVNGIHVYKVIKK
jgi:hypothetical protein